MPGAPTSTIRLSKVTLDKSRPSISLEKTAAGFGEIKVNLNWNQGTSGLLGGFLGKRGAIDLDLGCLFEMQDGFKGAVQALGNRFGDLREEPYIQLMGDDRTGSVADGEWLRINGQQWNKIERILIFAFIYDARAELEGNGWCRHHFRARPVRNRSSHERGRRPPRHVRDCPA